MSRFSYGCIPCFSFYIRCQDFNETKQNLAGNKVLVKILCFKIGVLNSSGQMVSPGPVQGLDVECGATASIENLTAAVLIAVHPGTMVHPTARFPAMKTALQTR